MNMASHVIDDMVLDIAFDADAGPRDDEWRSYLSARLLPAIASVLDRHSHRDGVLVLPQVELDLGDIPLDDFQEEMTRRVERQLADLLQHRQAQLASGEKGEVALVPHARRAIERLADFLTNGVLTVQEDIADAGSHQRLLDQVLDANPAGLHALLRLSAKRMQAVARLVAQFPVSSLQRFANILQPEVDVATLIDRRLSRPGKPLPPIPKEALRLQLWRAAIDALLDGRDVQNALMAAARIEAEPVGIAVVTEKREGIAAEIATDVAAQASTSDMPQQTAPASPHDDRATANADILHRQLLQACMAGDAATLSRLLEKGEGDAIRSALHAVAGRHGIAEKMAENLPASLLAKLIGVLQPQAGHFLRALYKAVSNMRPDMRMGVSVTERTIDPDADEWSGILERRLIASLFVAVLDALKTSAPLFAAIRHARQDVKMMANRLRQPASSSDAMNRDIVHPVLNAESLSREIGEKMSRLPVAASGVLQEVLFGRIAREASATSAGTSSDREQKDSIAPAAMQPIGTMDGRTVAGEKKEEGEAEANANAEDVLEHEYWRLALAVLLEREMQTTEISRNGNDDAVSGIENDQSFRSDANANTASESKGISQPDKRSSSHQNHVPPLSRNATNEAADRSMQLSDARKNESLQSSVDLFSERNAAAMQADITYPKTGRGMGHDIDEPLVELNDRSHFAVQSPQSKTAEIASRNTSLQNEERQKMHLPDNRRQQSDAAGAIPNQPAEPLNAPDALADADDQHESPDIAVIVDSMMQIADAWQSEERISADAIEHAPDSSASVETETNLRHRLAKALLTGDAAGLQTDWRRLLQQQPELIAQAVRHYMQMAGVLERLVRGFPETMLTDLLMLLEPRALALLSEQQKRLHVLTETEGTAARKSLWEATWQQLPMATQTFDATTYANALKQRTDAILQDAIASVEQNNTSENATLEQAYRRTRQLHDALLGNVALTPQAVDDAGILQVDFPLLLRQLIRALRSEPPSVDRLAYDESLYAVLLPQAIADGGTTLTDMQTAFLDAIASHARHAVDRSAYYRGVLAALLRGEAVDLDALASQKARVSANMANDEGVATVEVKATKTGDAERKSQPGPVDMDAGNPSAESRHGTLVSDGKERIQQATHNHNASQPSRLYQTLAVSDDEETEALQKLILETATRFPEAMQTIWDALRTEKLPAPGKIFTREIWRSLLIAWMRNRFSASETESMLATLDNKAGVATRNNESCRLALLNMLQGHTAHTHSSEPQSSMPPAEARNDVQREQKEAPAWQATTLPALLAATENDIDAQRSLHHWLRTGLSDHAPAARAALRAALQDMRMAGVFAIAVPEALLAETLAAIDVRHASKRFRADWVEDSLFAIDGALSSSRLRTAKWQHLLHRAATGKGNSDDSEYASDLARHLIEATGSAHADALLAAIRQPMPAIPSPRTNVAGIDENSRRQTTASASAPFSFASDAASPLASGGTKARRTRTASSDDTQETEDDRRNRPEQEIHIPNAGMVLAAPYIPHLFSLLKLTEQGRFVDPKAAERAVHLLQFMVDERTATPEYQLVLNKLLCGVKTGTPIAAGIDITDHERETVESLLTGLIANWGALGSTSIDGLRVSFLQRTGWLRRQEDGWHLQVERRAYDMLLDRLPWSFSMIRHSWMPTLLRVDWR
ncbi:contractile injection system tape measure protein [Oxalicibacterium solurbis]|uniref:Uncharacterized protein n=1 Tax=Oxalicibacterium solurbis TaxID=69280 RepID=A0A8J3F4U2_9BURK|nr:contractile injection system tape measure protein [Oxalicibacterium solurbis]GGI52858.1 hypothetical protein GCM10011430_00320 [Oxalicibacterium solurbis]